MTAFESKPDWLMIVKKNAPENAEVRTDNGAVLNVRCDLLLVDGEPVEKRAVWLKIADIIVKPGGWIVLDNANRPEYAREREGLKRYADLAHTVDSNGALGTSYLVTEFWRMKGGE